MGDLTALIKLVMLIEQIPSIDGCVDTSPKIFAEASIFRCVGAQLLPTPVLDFLAKVVKVLNCGEVTMLFGSWLIIHDGKRQRAQRRQPRWRRQGRGWVLEVLQKQGRRQHGWRRAGGSGIKRPMNQAGKE